MKILFLSRWFPFPPDNGSKLRIYHLLMGLSKSHEVTLLSFIDSPGISSEQLEQCRILSEVHVIPWKAYDKGSWTARLGLLSLAPRSLLDTYSPQMASLIRDKVLTNEYDLVIASQLTMASYYPCFQGLPALFEEIELGIFFDQAHRNENLLIRFWLKLTWFKLTRYLLHLLDSFQICSVASEQERQLFVKSFPKFQKRVEVVPNCINMEDYQELIIKPRSNCLIFSGSFRYHANYEAMQWFVSKIYPLILKEVPDVHLVITGDHAGLLLPPVKNVIMAGYVDDIKSLIASCSVSVAPLLKGGGTRLKILEAMAIGVPVVATTKGAEGLDAQNGEHLLVADDPELFAGEILRILKDKNLHDSLSANAAHFVKKNYEWSVIFPRFMKLVDRVSVSKIELEITDYAETIN